MKKFWKQLIATCALVPTLALADLTPAVFQQLSSGNKTEKGMVEMYVGGVVKGYISANQFLGMTNQQPLFCYSGDIDTGSAKKFTAQVVKDHLKKSPEDANKEIVEGLLLIALKTKYPC